MSKILVADDDRRIALALCVRLQASGHEVLLAHDGVTAVRSVIEDQPELLVLDISMPAGNGFHVAQVLLDNPTTAMIPVIFMTAKQDPDYFDEAMRRHAVGFLSKPFEEGALVALVDSSLAFEA